MFRDCGSSPLRLKSELPNTGRHAGEVSLQLPPAQSLNRRHGITVSYEFPIDGWNLGRDDELADEPRWDTRRLRQFARGKHLGEHDSRVRRPPATLNRHL